MSWDVAEGDCVALMAAMEPCSVDAVVTDPPYLISFMAREWDSVAHHRDMQGWHQAWATEALRVLKPGGHLLAFGGTRTYHRLVCAVEDAGFEIRDTIAWMYGSGFPKSLDVSKAIDRAAGAEREVVARERTRWTSTGRNERYGKLDYFDTEDGYEVRETTAPATPEAERWNGWGTALKPAHEPVVVARKPLSGTVAQTVVEWGTGALNIEGCRIGYEGDDKRLPWLEKYAGREYGEPRNHIYGERDSQTGGTSSGRWPANVVLGCGCEGGHEPGCAVRLLDEQTGERPGFSGGGPRPGVEKFPGVYGDGMFGGENNYYGDSDGASRFFYTAKAGAAERSAGLEGVIGGGRRNVHPLEPTVKPIELMRWLVRLVTPPEGIVLDPFCGSGSTGCAAMLEGFDFVGLEREPEYIEIARARIGWWEKHRGTGEVDEILAAGEARDELEATGQISLLDGMA